jgi:EAL domain-containing protein (putative c-di-GMP-specific phosphodiesterase class I)
LNRPVDVLKVDRSFVSGSAADHAGAVIVENLIGFTNGLNLEAVAEGVETPEQEQRLCSAGYRLAQGYLFGRPMPALTSKSNWSRPPITDCCPSMRFLCRFCERGG